EDDNRLRQWLVEHGHADARSLARLVQAPAAWQSAVETVLAPWLAGFAVTALATTAPPWPDETLTLVEQAAVQSAPAVDTLAGLPILASRIRAPAAIMAAAGNIFVADDVDAALAARGQLAPEQRIVSLDGACVGPAMLRTPAGDDNSRGVLERERS